jgi:hypothetical protein
VLKWNIRDYFVTFNPYKFIGESEKEAFLEKRLTTIDQYSTKEFNDYISEFEDRWSFSYSKKFDNLITYLTDNNWISADGAVLTIPDETAITGDYDEFSDVIVSLLEQANNEGTAISDESLVEIFDLSWEDFSDIDTKLSDILGEDFASSGTEDDGSPIGAAGIYSTDNSNIDSSDYAKAYEHALLEFVLIKDTLINLGKSNNKQEKKKKEIKKEIEKEEQKTLAIIREAAMKREQENKANNKPKQKEG